MSAFDPEYDAKYVRETIRTKYNLVPMHTFKKLFEYPNKYLDTVVGYEDEGQQKLFSLKKIYKKIIRKKNYRHELPDDGTLFDIVTKVYFCLEGSNDEFPWIALMRIKLKENYYFAYYVGFCDYTGFDSYGTMKLYISKSMLTLINFAMCYVTRFKVLRYVGISNYYEYRQQENNDDDQ